MLKSRSGDLKEGESIGGFLVKVVIALIGIIILVTVVPDVLGVNIANLCITDDGLLGPTTAKHCAADGTAPESAILTDTVRDIWADGYNFILVAVAVGLVAYGAVKTVQYRLVLTPYSDPIRYNSLQSEIVTVKESKKAHQ